MKLRKICCALNIALFSLLNTCGAQDTNLPIINQPAKWTVMIYAQADSILNNFAIKNFNAMATIGSNENLNIIVQWNQPKRQGTWRYKIDKDSLTLIQASENPHPNDFVQDLTDFTQFCVTKYPADNYMFTFWNHGAGIIDPEWSQLHQFAMGTSGMTIQQSTEAIPSFEIKRGILFDISNKKYLNNQELTQALEYTTSNILHKKFSVIGMDACLMAMFEVFYQIKNFADYTVSSEEVELAQGWNYAPFLATLARNKVDAQSLAKNIVTTFEDLYRGKTQFYTQSAIQLDRIDTLKQNIDQFVLTVAACKKIDASTTTTLITKARNECLHLSTSCYIDLHSFYRALLNALIMFEQETITPTQVHSKCRARTTTYTLNNNAHPLVSAPSYKNLKEVIAIGMQLIETVVIANTSSHYFAQAKGISIYYPQKKIDASYFKTSFAKDCLWIDFLQDMLSSTAHS